MAAVTTPASTTGATAVAGGRRPRARHRRLPVWHAFWILAAAAYFIVPVISLVQFSFGGRVGTHSAGFHWYATVFNDPSFRSSFWLSVQIAIETVVLSNLLLVPTAFWIHLRLPRLRPVMDFVSVLPFVVPPIVLIVGLIPFLQQFTFIYSRPEVLDFIYVVFAMPFLYRSLDAGLRAINLQTLAEASANCGGSTWSTLLRVVVPNLRSAIIGGSFLTVAIAMGEFTISSLLSFNTFPVYIFNIGQSTSNEAAALAVISLLLTWGLMIALYLVGRGGRTTAQIAATR